MRHRPERAKRDGCDGSPHEGSGRECQRWPRRPGARMLCWAPSGHAASIEHGRGPACPRSALQPSARGEQARGSRVLERIYGARRNIARTDAGYPLWPTGRWLCPSPLRVDGQPCDERRLFRIASGLRALRGAAAEGSECLRRAPASSSERGDGGSCKLRVSLAAGWRAGTCQRGLWLGHRGAASGCDARVASQALAAQGPSDNDATRARSAPATLGRAARAILAHGLADCGGHRARFP